MKITESVEANMRGLRNSGFSVVDSVHIEAGDKAGMLRIDKEIYRPFFKA